MEYTRYNDNNIKQISNLKNKITSTEIEKILKELNNTIFEYNRSYITNKITNYLLSTLRTTADKLKAINITPVQQNRVNEILNQCRTLYTTLQSLLSPDNINDYNSIEKNQKYQISLYINYYKKNTNLSECITFLLKQKQFIHQDNNNQNYITMLSELKTNIKKLVDDIAL